MSDRAYILMRTIEPQLAIAENNGMHEIWMTTGFVHEIVDVLKEQETSNLYKCPNCGTWVSAENVVRCKDCDNKECWGRAGDVVCGIDGTPHRPDWFCADGERRKE